MEPISIFQIIVSTDWGNNSNVLGIKSAIETRGGVCYITEIVSDDYDSIVINDDTECVLSVGGDGTLIAIAQQIVDLGIPLLGINVGHLGYLCDLDIDTIYDAIPFLMKGEYDIEERMMLEGYVRKKDGELTKPMRALNDIVVCSLNGLQVINICVYVGDEFLYSFNGDGMIFATPTGSTAYNLSANGPIVDPKTDVILMTPINPHTLNSRSIIIDRRDEVSLEINPRRFDEEESAAASFDGGNKEMLFPGDRIVLHRAKSRTKMIRLSKMSFLERIRRKMMTE